MEGGTVGGWGGGEGGGGCGEWGDYRYNAVFSVSVDLVQPMEGNAVGADRFRIKPRGGVRGG